MLKESDPTEYPPRQGTNKGPDPDKGFVSAFYEFQRDAHKKKDKQDEYSLK